MKLSNVISRLFENDNNFLEYLNKVDSREWLCWLGCILRLIVFSQARSASSTLKTVIGAIGHQSYKNVTNAETYNRNRRFVEAELKKRSMLNTFKHDIQIYSSGDKSIEDIKGEIRRLITEIVP